jgi:hypothetical protein
MAVLIEQQADRLSGCPAAIISRSAARLSLAVSVWISWFAKAPEHAPAAAVAAVLAHHLGHVIPSAGDTGRISVLMTYPAG